MPIDKQIEWTEVSPGNFASKEMLELIATELREGWAAVLKSVEDEIVKGEKE